MKIKENKMRLIVAYVLKIVNWLKSIGTNKKSCSHITNKDQPPGGNPPGSPGDP
jgi:hypothetical protein